MTLTMGQSMRRDSYGLRGHEPRERLSAYLASEYRTGHRAKLIAADLGCSPKTAENWLAGHWPGSRHWQAIVRRFGHDVLLAVFGPDIDETRARLAAEVRELEERLERTKAGLRKAGGAVAGAQGGLAPLQDRATVDAAAEPRSFRR